MHAAMDHALDTPRASRLPTWLGEGVAQLFDEGGGDEVEDTFALLVREHTYVPLASLDGPFVDIEDSTDARIAYHQSLAMVLYLVDRRGERGLAEAMQHLVAGRSPASLLSSIDAPLDGETLLRFLEERAARRGRWAADVASTLSGR